MRTEQSHPLAIERGVRQILADKVSGNHVGLWLLAPEHLRLGTWDLLCQWTDQPGAQVEPRLALQLVHEAALCVTGMRQARCLSQKGFELANGLPFVATDQAIHDLLDAHVVAEARTLQHHLGLVRRARDHFRGRLLAIDPHRMRSYTKRQTPRYRSDHRSRPVKTAQGFFCLDADTHQPVCLTLGTSALTVAQATPPLLDLAGPILGSAAEGALVVADTEHYTADLIDHVYEQSPFDLLVPMPESQAIRRHMARVPPERFQPHWAGLATARARHQLQHGKTGPHWQFIQRSGERPDDYEFKAFLCTADREEVGALTSDFPKRWHVEEFFNAHQALGWDRAGTLNLNIRYGRMSLALIAQAALHELRQRLEAPYDTWDAKHLAHDLLKGLDGDIRVQDDTILVTFYNAPNPQHLSRHYEHLPQKLQAEQVDPRMPWLYNLKLDFRFK